MKIEHLMHHEQFSQLTTLVYQCAEYAEEKNLNTLALLTNTYLRMNKEEPDLNCCRNFIRAILFSGRNINQVNSFLLLIL